MRSTPIDTTFKAMIAGLEQRGLSRSQIAARSGLSRQTIFRFAEGMARAPTLESYQRLAELVTKSGVPMERKP